MNRRNLCYGLYFGGCLTVFLQWLGLVSNGVGWIGWIIGMAGWALWPREKPQVTQSPEELKANDPTDT